MIRSDNVVVHQVIDYLDARGGSAPAAEICREVLGFDNCNGSFAVELLKKGLPDDHRLHVDATGMVVLGKRGRKAGRPLAACEFVVVDVEATSLPKPNNRIMEFAAVHLGPKGIGEQYETLINPTVSIPSYVRQMTGITDEMVWEAPLFEEIAEDIRAFIGSRILVAHNVPFDAGIINSEYRKLGLGVLANPAICTVRLSRALLPGLDRYRLGEVAEYFSIEIEKRHRASDDALAAARILERLIDLAGEKDITTLEEILKLSGLKKTDTW